MQGARIQRNEYGQATEPWNRPQSQNDPFVFQLSLTHERNTDKRNRATPQRHDRQKRLLQHLSKRHLHGLEMRQPTLPLWGWEARQLRSLLRHPKERR